MTLITNDIQHYNDLPLWWVSCFIHCYAKRQYGECRYAKCRYAECSSACKKHEYYYNANSALWEFEGYQFLYDFRSKYDLSFCLGPFFKRQQLRNWSAELNFGFEWNFETKLNNNDFISNFVEIWCHFNFVQKQNFPLNKNKDETLKQCRTRIHKTSYECILDRMPYW